jgi:uncharacterized protein (DUF1501 family)
MNPSRRDFLRLGAALGLGPALHPFGLRLAALGAAAGQTADYRALVCLFLFGGNDSANMVMATDPDSWGRYQSARNQGTSSIALAAPGAAASGTLGSAGAAALGGVLPIVPRTDNGWPAGTTGTGARTFALHPLMPNLQGLFAQGKAAVVANLGTLVRPVTKAEYNAHSVTVPRNLFSHNDQQSTWQTGSVEGARLGWGGLLGDVLSSANASPVFTAISVSGNAVLLSGRTTLGYQSSSSGPIAIAGLQAKTLFGSAAAPAALHSILTAPAPSIPSSFQQDYAAVVARSAAAQQQLANALGAVVKAPAPPAMTDPATGSSVANPVAQGLQTIANLIAAGRTLGMKRQVFFLGVGGFDTHLEQNSSHHRLMASLDGGLAYFQQTLAALNGEDLTGNVTSFTMSDFGRTFTSNGSGTDHGWGAHHLVVGGAVKGGDLYGRFPTVGVDLGTFVNPDALFSGVWIPTTSVDQYAATLGGWLGASASDLASIFPNLGNFASGGSATLTFL